MQRIEMPELICQRCNHKWTPRNKKIYLCPKCRSPKWDEPATPTPEVVVARSDKPSDNTTQGSCKETKGVNEQGL
jgi:hypothetical protein